MNAKSLEQKLVTKEASSWLAAILVGRTEERFGLIAFL